MRWPPWHKERHINFTSGARGESRYRCGFLQICLMRFFQTIYGHLLMQILRIRIDISLDGPIQHPARSNLR
jgi:hypothetical protein